MSFNPFSALTSKIFGGVSLVLLIVCGVLLARGNHYRAKADSWESAAKAQQQAVIAVAAAAQAKAIAQKITTENTTADLARRADHAEDQLDALRASADRFAAARRPHGVLCGAAAARSASGGPAPASEGDPAPDRDRPGADAVVLTRDEWDQLVANSLRLERVRQWGSTLIREKLALPEVEFGREEVQPRAASNVEVIQP